MTVLFPFIQKSLLNLIPVYPPTLTIENEDKSAFYDQLVSTILTVPESEKLFGMVDFNATVGRGHHLWKGFIAPNGIRK